jgi:hypothetical protein
MARDKNQYRGQAHNSDIRVSIMLFVLLIAIALRIPSSNEIGNAAANRESFFERAADLIVNLSLSIGASSLLLSNRPRNDPNGADQ